MCADVTKFYDYIFEIYLKKKKIFKTSIYLKDTLEILINDFVSIDTFIITM